jgi:hypothetical protein
MYLCILPENVDPLNVVGVLPLSSKGHNSHKIQGIKISWLCAQLHMVSLLPTKVHEILW